MKLGIKRGYIMLLILQAVSIGICALGLIHIYYKRNTNLLYQQTSSVLDLYMLHCENKLDMVERLSFSILSDLSTQKDLEALQEENDNPYDAYRVQQQVINRLTGYLFAISHCETVSFLTNDGVQLASTYSSYYQPFTAEEIAELRALSDSCQGKTVWLPSSDGNELHMLRTLRETHSGKFRNLGVLVLTCSIQKVFQHDFSQGNLSPIIQVDDEEGALIYTSRSEEKASQELEEKSYYTERRLSPQTGWYYSCRIHSAEMLREVNQLNARLIFFLLLVLAVSLVASLKFSISITSRIEQLSRNMDAVRAGNYRVPFKRTEARFTIHEVETLSENFNYMVHEIDHLINDIYKKQLMIKDMRYRMLLGQINPHFLYNTLDTVNSLAKQKGQQEISTVVQSLSRMLRASLSEQDMHTLLEEQRLLQSYIAIQKIRFEERLEFLMEDPALFHQVLIPKLTIQPLVENSIKYGLERYAKTCRIKITFAEQGEDLWIRVADNGPGMPAGFAEQVLKGEIKSASLGLGIKNVHERIQLAFGEEYGVSFESVPGEGTTAVIKIPLCPKEDQDEPHPAD